MALVLEDGTGLANSNSYGAVAAFKTYHDDRGNSYGTSNDTAIGQALIKATDYIDQRFGTVFKGQRKSDTQALCWPRDYAYTELGNVLTGLPVNLVKATFEYALAYLSGDIFLAPTVDASGIQVTGVTKKVGPIETSTTFQEGAAPQKWKRIPKADLMIRTLTIGGSVVRA